MAQTITDEQAPVITQMTGWLSDGNEAVGMGGMDHGTNGMGGMMSDDEMADLGSATATSASILVLTQMAEIAAGL
ncbi:MAG: DUF305 domain-containing protein [Burkholderiaceae bacterium]|nr:DUF305 domain-containing protein [Microbacteriaceae bacterium]